MRCSQEQIPVISSFTKTSRGPICGTGTSTISTFLTAVITAAFIVFVVISLSFG